MEVPLGFFAKLWSFVSILPIFFALLILGLLKAAIVGPFAVAIIVIGNSIVIIGLWPAHFFWSYFCLARTKRCGPVLKIVVLVFLPVPLILWPIFGIIGSLLGGIGYGFFVPLIATFEAVGDDITDKVYHCFADGCWSTIERSSTIVMDLTDFCFHSYFSYMDELSELMHADEKAVDVKLSRLPSCLLVTVIGVPVDMLFITLVALWKSPYMLLRGWKRLLEDLIGRKGPFSEAICIPFAGLAIILWPIAVIGAVISAAISSFFLGIYAGVIVHQEDSFQMGLAYVLSVISMFDEYVNDLLYLREGSCIPRPKYRRNISSNIKRENSSDDHNDQRGIRDDGSYHNKPVSEQSRTLKWTIQHYKPMQVWDWLFKSCEVNGRILLQNDLITVEDIGECILKGNCKKLSIKLPSWCVLQCLISSAKSNCSGLLIDDMELTRTNLSKDKMFEWFIGPLLIMKEQIKRLELEDDEVNCLRKLIMRCRNAKPEEWDDFGFPSSDTVKRAQLQAIIRRLQGIISSLSRIPSFRRRFRNLIKVLYVEAIRTSSSDDTIAGILRERNGSKGSTNSESIKIGADRIDTARTGPDIVNAV